MAPRKKQSVEDLESGSDSDSASSAGSRSKSPSPAPSGKEGSQSRSVSRSPARSGSGSPQSNHSAKSKNSSNASRSKSGSPVASNRSRSGSAHSHKSSSSSHKSHASGSPKDRKSRSRSPSGSHKSRSRSGSAKSRSASPKSGTQSSKSRSQSPKSRSHSPKSRSQSPKSGGSRSSKSRSASPKSPSQSPKSQAGRASRSKSRSASPKSRKSRSRSGSASSKSKSPEQRQDVHDSRSNSPNLMIDDEQSQGSKVQNKSRSHSRSRSKSKSKSKSRSRSHSKSSNASDLAEATKKKRAVLSDSDSDEAAKTVKRKKDVSDSGSDTSGKPKKKTKKLEDDSDEENVGEKKDDMTADALFGDASDISSEDEGSKKGSGRDERSRSRSRSAGRSDDDRRSGEEGHTEKPDEEAEVDAIPETRIDVDMPKILTELGKELHFVKLPNFLSVETRPYDPNTYEDEIDEEETLDEEGRARLKLKVENTLRWHTVFDKEGNAVKESNARLVKWSDGSMSLHLGSEIFDVYKQPLHGDHNHLFVRQGTGLQGQAVFRTKLSFRPHSTESFTHRKMTLSLADRSTKTSAIKILSQVGADPDADRKYQLKKEEMELRAAMRSRPSARPKKRASGAGGRGAVRAHDDSDDEGGVSLAAIKSKYKANQKSSGAAIYSSESETSDVERRAKRLDGAKALKDSDDEGDGSDAGGKTPQQDNSASGSGTEEE